MSTLSKTFWKHPLGISSRLSSQNAVKQTAINNTLYAHPDPSKPVIALSVDGCDVRHFDQALANGYMPHLHSLLTPTSHSSLSHGFKCPVSSVFPTCMRPNQISIVCGTPPSEHGIVGDYCLSDGDLTESECLFADSILTELSHDGVSVLFMSVNEELREQCAYSLHPNSTSLSVESLANGISNALIDQLPHIEMNENESLFLLELMSQIIINESIATPNLCYIALSPAHIPYFYDYRSLQIMNFMKQIDDFLAICHQNGCRYGVTSGFGTNYKLGFDADLFVVNVGCKMRECFAEYAALQNDDDNFDIFSLFDFEIVLQSNSKTNDLLFGFCHIHIIGKDEEMRKKIIYFALCWLRSCKGIYSSIGHEAACQSLELPQERIGDIVLLGDVDTVFSSSDEAIKREWKLSNGSLEESTVPLIMNERPTNAYSQMLSKGKGRNYHLFDVLLNGFDKNLQQNCPYKHVPSKYQYVGK